MFKLPKLKYLLSNDKLLYLLLSLLVIFIISYSSFSNKTKQYLQKTIRNPNILVLLLVFISITSYYHFPLGLLLMFSLLTILSGKYIEESYSVENFQNNNNKKKEIYIYIYIYI